MLPDLGSITYMQRAWRTFFNEGAWSWPWPWTWTWPKRRQNLGLGPLQQRTQTPIQTSGVQRRRDLASIDDKEEDEEQEEEQEERPSYQDETDKDNTRPPGARGARRRASQQIFKKA